MRIICTPFILLFLTFFFNFEQVVLWAFWLIMILFFSVGKNIRNLIFMLEFDFLMVKGQRRWNAVKVSEIHRMPEWSHVLHLILILRIIEIIWIHHVFEMTVFSLYLLINIIINYFVWEHKYWKKFIFFVRMMVKGLGF